MDYAFSPQMFMWEPPSPDSRFSHQTLKPIYVANCLSNSYILDNAVAQGSVLSVSLSDCDKRNHCHVQLPTQSMTTGSASKPIICNVPKYSRKQPSNKRKRSTPPVKKPSSSFPTTIFIPLLSPLHFRKSPISPSFSASLSLIFDSRLSWITHNEN